MSKLKKKIRECGMKQKDVARLAGVNHQAVSHLCVRGIRSVRTAKIYAALLRCSPRELIEI